MFIELLYEGCGVKTNSSTSHASAFLRLPAHMLEGTHMLEGIKNAANKRDVPYQSLIKVWLQEKLEEA